MIHVDIDAFLRFGRAARRYAVAGQARNRRLLDKRSAVRAASYEARKFGVHSAMPAVRAGRLCPLAIFGPPDFSRYRAVSRNVREILKRHTDLIEPLSLDEAYLDVTENKTGLPTATLVARTIREQIREELNLTASAGVAPNKFLAKLASDWRKSDGLFVIQPEDIDAFLLPLPVAQSRTLNFISRLLCDFLIGTALAVNPVEAPSKSCKAPLQGHSRCRYFK